MSEGKITVESALFDLRYCQNRGIAPNPDSLKKIADVLDDTLRDNQVKTEKITSLRGKLDIASNLIGRWISIRDRQPKKVECFHECDIFDQVVIYSKSKGVYTAWYRGTDPDDGEHHMFDVDGVYGGDDRLCDVTHWMPLPELPEGD